MFSETLLALLLGVLAGTFTGLTPGIHVNLIALLTLSFSPLLLNFLPPIDLIINFSKKNLKL